MVPLGKSVAWNWQQGCIYSGSLARHRPVIWNDREGDRFVAHIMDVATREHGQSFAIYALSPNGKRGGFM